MHKTILFIIFIFGALLFVTSTNFKYFPEKGLTASGADSSRFSKPHDVFPDNVNTSPLLYPSPPQSYEILTYTNVDITNNIAPQNEPSVKINKKFPNKVVAS